MISLPAFAGFRLPRRRFLLVAAALAGVAFGAPASSDPTASRVALNTLKRLSLEELLSMDVTSVTRRAEPIATTASAISILTGDDIRRSGATTLADALRFSTGLQVARVDGRTWAVASRGFNLNASNKLLVMLDGRSLYTPLFSGVFWDVQDTELGDLDRIEVVRGVGATMWGANAVNGVISFQTKNARDTLGTAITAGGGTEEREFASVRHGVKVADGVYARVYAKQYQRDDLQFPSGRDANDDARFRQAGFRVDGDKPGVPVQWTAQGDIYHGFLGATVGPDSRVAGGNLLARARRTFSDQSSLQFQGYYDRVERFVVGQFREWRDTFDADLQFDAAVGPRQHLITGLTARTSADRTSQQGTIRFSPANRRMTTVGAFAQDEISFLDDRLGLTLGVRADDNDSTRVEFQPGIRLAWHPDPRQTLWAAVSRAVRTPSRFDDDLRFVPPTGPTFVSGSDTFRSETVVSSELGYRIHPKAGWSVEVSVFANRYDDLRSQERATEPDVLFVLGNRLNAETRGGEIAVNAQVADFWRVRAMYAHLWKRLSLDPDSTDITAGASEGNDPSDHWTLVSSWDLGARWEFDALLRHVGSLPSPATPAYTELDLHLAWKPSSAWELSLVGQNLLHPHHPEFGAGPAAHELQRGGYAKVTWHF